MTSILLSDLLIRAARCWPETVAIADTRGAIRYSELLERARRVAGALRGVAPSGRFAVWSSNRTEIAELYWAAAIGGLTCVPLNPRLTGREVSEIVVDAEVEVLLADESLAGALPSVAAGVIAFGTDYERLVERGEPFEASGRSSDDTVLQLYTSGTTGVPKGAQLSHSGLLAIAWSAAVERVVVPGDMYFVPTPMCHVTGGNRVFSAALVGAGLEVAPQFDAEDLLRKMTRGEVSATVVVPTMFRMLAECAREPLRAPTLRRISYGTAPISAELLIAVRDVFACELQQGYGLTESCGHAAVLPPDDHLDPSSPRLASVGRPAAGVRLRVVRADGTEADPGETGEVYIRSANVMTGYWKRPHDTEAVLQDGWLRTGDVGLLGEQDYLYLVGRRSDMLVSGGFNVYPSEVESQLLAHPAVQECAVVGVPDARWGETPAAAIVVQVGAGEIDLSDLDSWARERLAAYKIPRRWRLVSELPRNALGKVDKPALQAQLEDAVEPGAEPGES